MDIEKGEFHKINLEISILKTVNHNEFDQANQHKEKKKTHHCTYCGKKFNRLEFLRNHERIHTGEKPYQCLQCEKKFTQSSTLWKHTRASVKESKGYPPQKNF